MLSFSSSLSKVHLAQVRRVSPVLHRAGGIGFPREDNSNRLLYVSARHVDREGTHRKKVCTVYLSKYFEYFMRVGIFISHEFIISVKTYSECVTNSNKFSISTESMKQNENSVRLLHRVEATSSSIKLYDILTKRINFAFVTINFFKICDEYICKSIVKEILFAENNYYL